MRKIRIVAVGKDKESWVADGVAHYRKLLSRYASIELESVAKARLSASATPDEIRKTEGQAILRMVQGGATVALSDAGRRMTSSEFARALDNLTSHQRGVLTFIIGGPHGLDPKVISQADTVLSLSPLTFSHQIVRLVLLEQLYRAFTILEGGDYHK
ncbi:MAG: 23S rRNA (pseudouridine(1915)-N(3))-methyltransferase RlmH [candidate division Zixibacteria bacterium]|nr:23S rRNA (pseudouridine(1915)-N(3))-methyltransferase RlmH [candidate division Zixibacteria bacterium]